MTVRITGAQCSEAGCMRPVFEVGLCRAHYDLARAFHDLPCAEILDHQSLEFSRELNAWRSGLTAQ